MKIRGFDVGVENISRWRRIDETHLPVEGELKPEFSSKPTPLDEILRPPTLDERIPLLTAPDDLDPELLQPRMLEQTKAELLDALSRAMLASSPDDARAFADAAALLTQDIRMDDDVRSALTALFRG